MKKIFRYVVLLAVVYLVVEIFVYFLTKPYYREMNNYEVLVENPEIKITESKVAKNKGYIEGYAINNTKDLINNLRIKFDFYNEQCKYIGSEYETIEIFNATEKVNFYIKYQYKNVSEIKISIIKE